VRFEEYPELTRAIERRRFFKVVAGGTVVVALGGGTYVVASADDPRARALRPDGRPRLPPGQRLLNELRPMGGDPGNPSPASFRLKVHGDVDSPFEVTFSELLAMPQVDQSCDVHCVTGWSVFDSHWRGVQVAHLARLARPKPTARHVIFEAAHGYTSNARIAEALAPDVLVAHQLSGNSLPRPHGAPVRGLVPDLYFWKSPKWLTGIRFARDDAPGYWETRGYHNHADPWKEERYG
jgi:DMSO/TMAO reductase YedYZ molybdopterin-dependent catalytic subunit